MNTATLDERIRKQAKDRLRADIRKAAEPLMKALDIYGTTNQVKILTVDKEEVRVYDKHVIERFIETAVERQAPKVEDRAVGLFFTKVEGLQEQIDNLFQEVG